MLEGSKENGRGAGTDGEDEGEGSKSPRREDGILDIHVRFKKCLATPTIGIILALLLYTGSPDSYSKSKTQKS